MSSAVSLILGVGRRRLLPRSGSFVQLSCVEARGFAGFAIRRARAQKGRVVDGFQIPVGGGERCDITRYR
jgi:hypothetical protein